MRRPPWRSQRGQIAARIVAEKDLLAVRAGLAVHPVRGVVGEERGLGARVHDANQAVLGVVEEGVDPGVRAGALGDGRETAAVVVTGNGLKDVQSAIRANAPPIDLPPSLDALDEVLQQMGMGG